MFLFFDFVSFCRFRRWDLRAFPLTLRVELYFVTVVPFTGIICFETIAIEREFALHAG